MATKRVACPACGGPFRVEAMAFLDMSEAELVDKHCCDTSGTAYTRENEAENRDKNDTYTEPAGGASQ